MPGCLLNGVNQFCGWTRVGRFWRSETWCWKGGGSIHQRKVETIETVENGWL